MLSVEIFADGNYTTDAPYITGLLYSESAQLVSQLISIGAVIAWGFGASLAVFALIKYTMGCVREPRG